MKISQTPDYKEFRSSVSQLKRVVDGGTEWTYYDAGPKTIKNPIIFLPPVCGTADMYFRQLLSLSAAGIRAISVNHPVCWSVDEWCGSFNSFLNVLEIDRVHIFGASLGGFLAQKFGEYCGAGRRVRSMVLCNAFSDTDVFRQTGSSSVFWTMPAVMLRSLVMGNLEENIRDETMALAQQFMSEKLNSLTQKELASRLTMNCSSSYVQPQAVELLSSDVTLMNVFDGHALSSAVMNEMYKMYPNSRKALLKTGGNFPYLSRSDEVNIYIQVHLNQYADSIYSASEPRDYGESSTQPSTSQSEVLENSENLDPLSDNTNSNNQPDNERDGEKFDFKVPDDPFFETKRTSSEEEAAAD